MNLLYRLLPAAFLSVKDYGVWGITLATLFVALLLKGAGVHDKYIQQSEADQERAFQKAFTIDLALSALAIVLAAIALSIFALMYGQTDIIAPGLCLSLAFVGNSLQAPIWIHYRRMEFVRQRALSAIDPCTALLVTVAFAAAGFGYWSMVIGALTGSFLAAAVAIQMSPHPLAIRYDRGTLRDYASFSWPLVVGGGTAIATAHVVLLVAVRAVGLAAAGAISLASSITYFAGGVDRLVTATLYPAICAMRNRADVLLESFVKSNRLALMWGLPFGVGAALFAGDAIHFVLGDRWDLAIILIQAFGVAAAVDQVGLNWTAYMRAMDWTRPIAVLAGLNLASAVVIIVPLAIAFELPGVAAGWLVMALIQLVGRAYYLRQLFAGFGFLRHAARALAPSIPPACLILIVRGVTHLERTPALAAAELTAYAGLTVGLTILIERDLLREMIGYLRRPARAAQPVAPA